MSKKDREKRKERYRKLREAGYNSKEATTYKDHTDTKVDELIKAKEKFKTTLAEIRSKTKGV